MTKNDDHATIWNDRHRSAQLAISIVSHGHGPLLAALLDDLAEWHSSNSTVIVTLNVPEDDGFDRLRWPGVEWIDNPVPKGFGANHNAALLGHSSRWYAILNPDIRVGSDVFAALIDHAKNDVATGLIAPGVVGPDGAPQDSARLLLTPVRLLARIARSLARPKKPDATTRRELDWVAGMFMLFTRDAFEAVEGFDERFFLYCEDMDICVRLQLAGFQIDYVRDIEVVHDARRHSHRSVTYLLWHLTSLLRAWSRPAFWIYRSRRGSDRSLSVGGDRGRAR